MVVIGKNAFTIEKNIKLNKIIIQKYENITFYNRI